MKCCCTEKRFGEEGGDLCWFQLLPCLHEICVNCFSVASAGRGCKPFLVCPACEKKVREWKVVRLEEFTIVEEVPQGRRTRSKIVADTVTVERNETNAVFSDKHTIPPPASQAEPTQYHHNLDPLMRKETTILSLTVPDPSQQTGDGGEGGSFTITTEIVGSGKGVDEVCSDESKDNLEDIFLFLHSKMLTGFECDLNGFEQFGATYGGHNLDEITESDKSMLLRCFYALATGQRLNQAREGSTLWKNQRASAFAAADIIRNLGTKTNSGALKTLIGHQLLAYTIPQALHHILNKFGVCPSHQYNRITEIRSGEDVLAKSFLLGIIDAHDLVMILFDNIGFRRCGSKPGYDQFVALQILRIPKEIVMKWGLYPDPENPNQALVSWDNGKCWEEVRDHTSYDEIFGINEDDVSNLAKMPMDLMETLIGMEAKGELPTITECHNLANLGKHFSWPSNIPKEKRKTTVVETEGGSNFATASVFVEENTEAAVGDDVAAADTGCPEVQQFETNYDANNVIVDRPIAKDLNSREAVKILMEYGIQLHKKVTEKDVDEHWQNVEKVCNMQCTLFQLKCTKAVD